MSAIAETAAPADAKTKVSDARCGRCGDGSCVKSCGETRETCPIDCGGVGEPSVAPAEVEVAAEACGRCGDGWCVAMCGETAENCPSDCGIIKPTVEATPADCSATVEPAKKAEPKKE
ncbi:MAG TPA: hypothetical protein VGF69_11610 [Thermoanaerobaculia bacterium]